MPRKTPSRELVTNLTDAEKLKLLNEHTMPPHDAEGNELEGPAWPSLEDSMYCLHCDKSFKGRDARIFVDHEMPDGRAVECGTPGCDGSPLDFAKEPWWRGDE